jgi:two-component system nitrogen regulation response regulator GlnG
MEALMAFDYPGNIRQLENFCHWLTVMSSGQTVDLKDLPPEVLSAANAPANEGDGQKGETQASKQVQAQAGVKNDQVDWIKLLAETAKNKLERNEPAIMATLTREFESALLKTALRHCRDRKAEAAQRLGIGRNTLTRKCQELDVHVDS